MGKNLMEINKLCATKCITRCKKNDNVSYE